MIYDETKILTVRDDGDGSRVPFYSIQKLMLRLFYILVFICIIQIVFKI